jgi:hypothetical protein
VYIARPETQSQRTAWLEPFANAWQGVASNAAIQMGAGAAAAAMRRSAVIVAGRQLPDRAKDCRILAKLRCAALMHSAILLPRCVFRSDVIKNSSRFRCFSLLHAQAHILSASPLK